MYIFFLLKFEWLYFFNCNFPQNKKPIYAITLVGVGVTFLDFSADSLNSPMRALLLDTCSVKDQDTGLNIQAFLAGVGASCGYILAGLVTNMQTLFYIVASIFISCVISTMTSAKEKPFQCSKIPTKDKLTSNIYSTKVIEVNNYAINIEKNPDQIKKENDNFAKYFLHVIILVFSFKNSTSISKSGIYINEKNIN